MYDVNLYPPIFNQPYMPAFIIGQQCRIYFQLSSLNGLNSLYKNGQNRYIGVQYSIRKQKNNESALKGNVFKNGIQTAELIQDNNVTNDAKYYIVINANDLQGGFTLNEYYKVQIRFTGMDASAPPAANSTDFSSWLSNNLQYFSQWSSVVLIRGISQPTANIMINNSNATSLSVNTDYNVLSGQVTFANGNDKEKLERYRVFIYDNYNELVEDSGDLYSTSNLLNYTIKTSFFANKTYTIRVFLVTDNLFQWWATNRTITRTGTNAESSDMILQEDVNNVSGYIKIKLSRNLNYKASGSSSYKFPEYYSFNPIQGNNMSFIVFQGIETIENINSIATDVSDSIQSVSLNLNVDTVDYDSYWERLICTNDFTSNFLTSNDHILIRRTSSATQFGQWKEIANFQVSQNDIIELYWYDFTAEPGIWYKYQVIRSNSQGNKTAELVTPELFPVMLDTQDIFLNANGEELIIKFDPVISNLSNKVAESVTDTIGSKYPFFRRNGNVDYKTFSLSGTISCFMDIDNNVFKSSPRDLYKGAAYFYERYNNDNNINLYNDAIYEKHFRDKVMKFLQANNVKLLRSLTEGNILVKLTNISFTPNQTLGRRIYSFSCTAHEVAACEEENYLKFNIMKDNVKEIKNDDGSIFTNMVG